MGRINRLILFWVTLMLSQVLWSREILIVSNGDIQGQFSKKNTTYCIESVIDLKRESIHIPLGCTLRVKSGGIVNGELIGLSTLLLFGPDIIVGVSFSGTWNTPEIPDSIFDTNYLSDSQIIKNINNLQSDSVDNRIVLRKPHYYIEIDRNKGMGLVLTSNTSVSCSSTIHLIENKWTHYYIVAIIEKENVSFDGGEIVGDYERHTYVDNSTSEWGMGIEISSSKNVSIRRVNVSGCTGDGIYITGHSKGGVEDFSDASKDILIDSVRCVGNRRQELSLIHVDGIVISNSFFSNYGKSETIKCFNGIGIDIEPNQGLSIRNVKIENCKCFGNKGCSFSSYGANREGVVSRFKSIYVSNSTFDGLAQVATAGVSFHNCVFSELVIRNVETLVNASFEDCSMNQIDGINIYSSYSTKQHTNELPGSCFSLIFKRCIISSSSNSSKIGKGLIYFTGRDKNLDGVIRFEESRLFIEKSAPSSYQLLKNNQAKTIEFISSIIDIPERPLESVGYKFQGDTIICDHIILNSSDSPDIFHNCSLKVSNKDYIFRYPLKVSSQRRGFEIIGCYSDSKSLLMSTQQPILKTRCRVWGNRFLNDNLGNLR